MITLVQDEGIVTLTINRPRAMNALNSQTIDEIDAALDSVDSQARAMIITGAGDKAFVAGADITGFKNLSQEDGVRFSQRGQQVFQRIEDFHLPVVAAVNGYALGGGCELAMACHLRVAAPYARFGLPELTLGLIPGYGGTQRLVQLVGKGRAMEIILTGRMLRAQEALELGLVNRISDEGNLIGACEELIASIIDKAPLAISAAIRSVNASGSGPDKGYAAERENFGDLIGTEDFEEGVDAFLNKRKPSFKGA